MKKNYFLLFAFFLLVSVNAQVVEFKDSNFKTKLLQSSTNNAIAKDLEGNFCKIDANDDNEIQLTEALNISKLNLYQSQISDLSGISNFSNLSFLDCSGNVISDINIDDLTKIDTLYCAGMNLEKLDVTKLSNLKFLNCSQTNLTSLKVSGLSKLSFLDFSFSKLTEIDLSGLISLKTLICSESYSIKSLDFKGLIELELINCGNNESITELKNLSDCKKLKTLDCPSNKLQSLNVLDCPSLEVISCRFNKFSSLNISGLKNLRYLDLGGLDFTSIELNTLSNVETIRIFGSGLTVLDLTNFVKIKDVYCDYNDYLTTVFSKNGVNEVLSFSACPKLEYICADESQFGMLEEEIKNFYTYKKINYNSYCSFTPGGTYYTIKGQTKLDINNNGCDNDDVDYSNLNFSISNGLQKGNFISDNSGDYDIPVGEGTHIVTPIIENSNYFKVSPESVSITFPSEVNSFTQNFCVTPNGNHQDLEITLLSVIPARPGFDAKYKLVYKNKGAQTKSGSVSLDFNDAVLDFISATPLLTSQVTNKLSWDYENLQPFETREITIVLNVNSPMETPAVNINDRLSFNALILPVTDDEKPVDNSFALRQIVVGSYDPNDKTCLEGDVITPELIGEYVHYLIRFENTGTYSAENIVVKDMIDLSKFDISTLVPTGASHSYVTKISDGNKVEFIFEKINLPFDDAHNDGYIAFKIKTLPTLSVGDSFENEANIYFDYNFPILTNKAISTFKTLGTKDFEFSNYFNVYPNPVRDVLNISTKNDIEIESVSIYDVLGQLVIAAPNAKNISIIDVSKLNIGNYILKVKSNKGTSSSKFIKK
jgi:Leucine-rich repeat (LRR) protein